MASTVLIVEDDPDTVKLVGLYLKRDGHKVLTAGDGIEGLRLAREARPDLVVLDLMLPRLDGMEVCRVLRDETKVPIVMRTARVRAVLRRAVREAEEHGPEELEYGNIKVSLVRRAVYVEDAPVQLTPTEFRLLAMLVREPGRTFSREQVIDGVFGYDFDGFDRTVDAHVANLRRKLERASTDTKYINTVYGPGYRFGDA